MYLRARIRRLIALLESPARSNSVWPTAYVWLLPLIGLFLISLLLHRVLGGWDGFWINLATNTVAIIITLTYVEWLLRRRYAAAWSGASSEIASHLGFFVWKSTLAIGEAVEFSIIADGGGLAASRLLPQPRQSFDTWEWNASKVKEIVQQNLEKASKGQVKRLVSVLLFLSQESKILLDVYGGRLEPAHFRVLIRLHDHARIGALIWPDTRERLGVSRHDMMRAIDKHFESQPSVIRESLFEAAMTVYGDLHDLSRLLGKSWDA